MRGDLKGLHERNLTDLERLRKKSGQILPCQDVPCIDFYLTGYWIKLCFDEITLRLSTVMQPPKMLKYLN